MDFLDADDGELSEQIRVCSSAQKVDRANHTGWINPSSRTNKIILNCVYLVAVVMTLSLTGCTLTTQK